MDAAKEAWNYLVAWEFDVRPDSESQFEEAYGSDGDWVRLFRKGTGFVRTELTKKLDTPRRYVTLDFWRSKESYDAFRKQHQAEYVALDMRCEGLTEREVEIGRLERIG